LKRLRLSNMMLVKHVSTYLIIFTLFLAACAPATAAPARRFSFNQVTPTLEVPPTETPIPHPTPVPVPIVQVARANGMNPFLVDSRGMTLYILRKDTPGAGSTAPVLWGCTSGCAANWPAYSPQADAQSAGTSTQSASGSSALLAGPGVTGVLGVFTRPDDIRQITYNGWPLYHFAGDKMPGDVNGDGIGNLWAAAPVNMAPLTFNGLASPLFSGVPVTGNGTAASNNPSIVIGGNPTLGDFLVDARYRTLYVFRRDYPGASHCYDECAANWPPYIIQQDIIQQDIIQQAGPTIEAGLTGLVGVITRPDGTRQVTYNGWPLYYFAGDLNPGDANGDGVNNNWYVIGLNGFPDESQNQDDKDHGHNY
jgi:predicted lipoprotein with Yx(FWY)xxD motif